MQRTAARVFAQTFVAAFLFVSIPAAFADVTCLSNQPGTGSSFAFPGDATFGATKFTPSADCTVTAVGLLFSNSTGSIHAEIYNDVAGSPGTLLESGSDVTANSSYATSTFAGTTFLASGTDYWLVFHQASGGGSTIMVWDFGSGTYKSGSNGITWSGGSTGGATFTVDGLGSTPPSLSSDATSTPEEIGGAAIVLWSGVVAFFIGVIGTIWMYSLVV